MLYRMTFLNDNGWAITHDTVEAVTAGEAHRICWGNHPMGCFGRVSVRPESDFPPPIPPPTFDRSTGRYTWPEKEEA